jgi:hypothetical protein
VDDILYVILRTSVRGETYPKPSQEGGVHQLWGVVGSAETLVRPGFVCFDLAFRPQDAFSSGGELNFPHGAFPTRTGAGKAFIIGASRSRVPHEDSSVRAEKRKEVRAVIEGRHGCYCLKID